MLLFPLCLCHSHDGPLFFFLCPPLSPFVETQQMTKTEHFALVLSQKKATVDPRENETARGTIQGVAGPRGGAGLAPLSGSEGALLDVHGPGS